MNIMGQSRGLNFVSISIHSHLLPIAYKYINKIYTTGGGGRD
jgi:hypothetical protein